MDKQLERGDLITDDFGRIHCVHAVEANGMVQIQNGVIGKKLYHTTTFAELSVAYIALREAYSRINDLYDQVA